MCLPELYSAGKIKKEQVKCLRFTKRRFSLQRIANAGYGDEICHLRTASTYIQVYNSILTDSFSQMVPLDDMALEEQLPNIVVRQRMTLRITMQLIKLYH